MHFDVGDQNDPTRHQHLSVETNTFRLQHSSPTSMRPKVCILICASYQNVEETGLLSDMVTEHLRYKENPVV